MQRRIFVLIALLAAVFGALGGYIGAQVQKTDALSAFAPRETAYERIMRTRTIRCGYFVWPPFTVKDPNTGVLSGFNSDFMEMLGKALDLKIEWTQDLNFGTYLQDLADGRYDMECSTGWPNAKRGQRAYFAKPFAFMPLVALVRADDTRFDQDLSLINAPSVSVATIDGETSSVIHDTKFPQAGQMSLPSNSPVSDIILNVVSHKADVTFLDIVAARQYEENNLDKVKILNPEHPISMIALGPTLPQDDRTKQMIDIAIDQLQNSGQIEALLKKYEDKNGSLFLRVNASYQH